MVRQPGRSRSLQLSSDPGRGRRHGLAGDLINVRAKPRPGEPAFSLKDVPAPRALISYTDRDQRFCVIHFSLSPLQLKLFTSLSAAHTLYPPNRPVVAHFITCGVVIILIEHAPLAFGREETLNRRRCRCRCRAGAACTTRWCRTGHQRPSGPRSGGTASR